MVALHPAHVLPRVLWLGGKDPQATSQNLLEQMRHFGETFAV